MYVIPLIFTVAVLLVFLFGTLIIGLSAVKIKSMGTGGNQIKVLSKEYRDELIKAYNKVFASFNMEAMTDMLTDYMNYTTKCTLDVLRKLGLRKEVTLTPDPEYEKSMEKNPFNLIQSDGKNDVTLSTIKGKYTETYFDNNTNKKVYSRTRDTDYSIEFIKSNHDLSQRPCHCINCGDELVINGNMLDCPSCNTHYDAENYKWNISHIMIDADAANPWAKPVLILGVIVIIASLISIPVKSILFTGILLLIDIVGAALTFLYLSFLNKTISVLKQMEKVDPKSSRMVFFKRVNYLVRTLEMAKDFDLPAVKAFMTPELYTKLRAANEMDDYYLVDMDIQKIVPSNYRIKDGNQYVDIELTIDRLMINPKKKIKQKTAKVPYTLFKSVDAKTKVNSSAQAITCPNCGANLNLVHDGKCTFCESGIDISKFDWIFSEVPLETTK